MSREPGRRGDHVLLGDAALEKAIRIRQLERADAAVRREVGVENDQVLVLGPELDERVPVRLGHVLVRDLRTRPDTALGLPLEVSATTVSGGATGSSDDRLEPERLEPHADPPHELGEGAGERLVVGRARVPPVRPASVAESRAGAP